MLHVWQYSHLITPDLGRMASGSRGSGLSVPEYFHLGEQGYTADILRTNSAEETGVSAVSAEEWLQRRDQGA